jgi:hypothetical protein
MVGARLQATYQGFSLPLLLYTQEKVMVNDGRCSCSCTERFGRWGAQRSNGADELYEK